MTADSQTKNRFSIKLLAIALIVIIAIAVTATVEIYWRSSDHTKAETNITLPALNLTLIGADGQQVVLNSTEFAALKPYTGKGGFSENGESYAGNFTGIPVLTLLSQVGGISTGENTTFTGSDGYSFTFTYEQIHGDEVNTFNPTTGAPEQPTQPLTVMVAYYNNGTGLDPSIGPLRVAVVGPQGLYTNGFWWVYFLVKIQVNP